MVFGCQLGDLIPFNLCQNDSVWSPSGYGSCGGNGSEKKTPYIHPEAAVAVAADALERNAVTAAAATAAAAAVLFWHWNGR